MSTKSLIDVLKKTGVHPYAFNYHGGRMCVGVQCGLPELVAALRLHTSLSDNAILETIKDAEIHEASGTTYIYWPEYRGASEINALPYIGE